MEVGSGGAGLATKGVFVPSDPKNTEVGWGVVHLYRESKETPGLYDDTTSSADSDSGQGGEGGDVAPFNEEDCTTLCILAVPSYMTPSDLLGYVGERTREDVSHFRLIRTGRANKYMVLMKFREAKRARQWQKEWNGKLFNSMEPENCHVVFVKSITFQTPESSRETSTFPQMKNDPLTPASQAKSASSLPSSLSSPVEPSSIASKPLSTKPLAPPTPSLVELPTCPVCLERMDETTGLLTILCQHVFHCACLEKWRGSGCPVCRYTQSDTGVGRNSILAGSDPPENECSVCGTFSNLWICLICGNTGCGRYDSAHAFAHYVATGHSYAMDIATQHVWDYAGDGYVHRLIQNKADGKLVDLPAAFSRTGGTAAATHPNNAYTSLGTDTVPREKLDNMAMEYAYLLTSQLDSQRLYFEEQVERAADKAATAFTAAEKAAASADAATAQLEAMRAQVEAVTAGRTALEKDLERQARRADKAEQLARSVRKEWAEEKAMNGALMQRIGFLDEKLAQLEKRREELEGEKRELADQNRDLTFFISSREKLEAAGVGEDVVEGRVEVPEPPPPPPPSSDGQMGEKGKRKKGKGRR